MNRFEKLPNNILEKILDIEINDCDNMNKILEKHKFKVEKETNMKNFNNVIKHLETYAEEWDFEENAETVLYILNTEIRLDCRFLEYNNLWDTPIYEIIKEIYGEDRLTNFYEEDF